MPQSYVNRIYFFALAASIPSTVLALVLLWQLDMSSYGKTFISLLLLSCVLLLTAAVRHHISYQFQSLTVLVEAIKNGDFSLRGTRQTDDDPLSELIAQINELSDALHKQRLASKEAYQLLDKIVNAMDVAIFAFDAKDRVSIVNEAAAKLLDMDRNRLVGQSAESIGLSTYLASTDVQLKDISFPGANGKWQIKLDSYRLDGVQQKLIFIHDLRQVLRDEELKAWKNLIRVISHEVNNSLYPVSSLAQTLKSMFAKESLADDWQQDAQDSLQIISERVEQLTGFIKRYTKVASVPEPQKTMVSVEELLSKTRELFPAESVLVDTQSSQQQLFVDQSLIEQVLINLIKNGIEAGEKVRIHWTKSKSQLSIHITDDGPGIQNSANLFVPFYTTKTNGSGIGLVLCRQLVEVHGGALTLENAAEGGCVATVSLPVIN